MNCQYLKLGRPDIETQICQDPVKSQYKQELGPTFLQGSTHRAEQQLLLGQVCALHLAIDLGISCHGENHPDDMVASRDTRSPTAPYRKAHRAFKSSQRRTERKGRWHPEGGHAGGPSVLSGPWSQLVYLSSLCHLSLPHLLCAYKDQSEVLDKGPWQTKGCPEPAHLLSMKGSRHRHTQPATCCEQSWVSPVLLQESMCTTRMGPGWLPSGLVSSGGT